MKNPYKYSTKSINVNNQQAIKIRANGKGTGREKERTCSRSRHIHRMLDTQYADDLTAEPKNRSIQVPATLSAKSTISGYS